MKIVHQSATGCSFTIFFLTQDLICQHETQVAKLISKGAVIYVCGDEKNMAKDVMKAVTNAIQNVHNVSTEEATKTVFQLQKDKRYLQDIWT